MDALPRAEHAKAHLSELADELLRQTTDELRHAVVDQAPADVVVAWQVALRGSVSLVRSLQGQAELLPLGDEDDFVRFEEGLEVLVSAHEQTVSRIQRRSIESGWLA